MYIPEYIPPQEEACSRETTAPLEDDQAYAPNDTSYPKLHLAFNPGPKGNQGFVFGWDPDCDIVLPRLQSISRRHCVLKFDDQRRPILRDISSTGTIVSYDDQGGEIRRRFTWILGGHEVPQGKERIIIQIHKYIRLQITVSRHDKYPDLCNENVDLFEMGALGLRSASSSIAPTPRPQDPIRLKQETLGKGTFAVVRRFWDVSTGLEYAYKEPLDKRNFEKRAWEKEADILKQISHVSQ
jgi:serine/threonine-protein kinase Chk2